MEISREHVENIQIYLWTSREHPKHLWRSREHPKTSVNIWAHLEHILDGLWAIESILRSSENIWEYLKSTVEHLRTSKKQKSFGDVHLNGTARAELQVPHKVLKCQKFYHLWREMSDLSELQLLKSLDAPPWIYKLHLRKQMQTQRNLRSPSNTSLQRHIQRLLGSLANTTLQRQIQRLLGTPSNTTVQRQIQRLFRSLANTALRTISRK